MQTDVSKVDTCIHTQKNASAVKTDSVLDSEIYSVQFISQKLTFETDIQK